ncbi:LysR family transcriptional regulator [Marinomonas rhizomae]|uniref:LysR family glycine cleavage system transcriptional activator n=1 Tax=Marinomonas rhizomae TaxID=491948 RepID=A0A366IY11_9GAMM|nr:LysR substrate-binding domain-containing protein [Marinomonas rhizomae]RBP79562.1 LysR family glycine cleavage system transcriptional activator [Marinomonas rhizomae]RNF71566.1 LysR family transcriptional regulator [Marinomonas rhizomae]
MFQQLPSLNAIKAFESAARLNSFKDAANELNVTPTAISHQIRALEDSLKVRLFERKTRAVTLTTEGKLLAASANQSLQDLLSTVSQLKGSSSTLTISTTSSFAAMWLVPNLADFQQQYPGIDIQIRAEETLIDMEHDRRVDMAIRYGEPPKQREIKALTHQPLVQESLGFFATPEYWEKHRKNLSDVVFFCTQWKNPNLPNLGLEETIKSIVVDSRPNIRYFDDENLTAQAALSGQGIAIISQLAVENSIKNGWLTQGTDKMSKSITGLHYYLVIPKRVQTSQAAIHFKEWLQLTLAKVSP